MDFDIFIHVFSTFLIILEVYLSPRLMNEIYYLPIEWPLIIS